jgi:hypothetical protein
LNDGAIKGKRNLRSAIWLSQAQLGYSGENPPLAGQNALEWP